MKRLTCFIVAVFATITNTACSTINQSIPAPSVVVHTSIFKPNLTHDQRLLLRVAPVIKSLKSRIGKTWYVFSGDQPTGWDCSGLTRWAYKELGYTLPHSASKQAHVGRSVVSPQIGDIVVFAYGNYVVHSAVYVGNNKVIHAGFHKGMTTAIIDLGSRNFDGMKIMFRRILPNVPIGVLF